MSSSSSKTSSVVQQLPKRTFVTVLSIAFLSVAVQIVLRGEPLIHIVPNLLFLFPYLCRIAPHFWVDPSKLIPEIGEHKAIREIPAEEYSYEKLREVTENFYYPAVIRGIFNNTVATKRWTEKGYLASKIGQYMVDIRFCDVYGDVEHIFEPFEKGFHELLGNENSKSCLFFPLFTRAENKTTIVDFKNAVTKLAREDLNLERLRQGFASEAHTNLHGCQMVAGRGIKKATPGKFIGLGWHAEPGTNWFAQVKGRKRWYVMDPIHSNLMMPFFETTTVFRTSDMSRMNELHDRLPLYWVDLNEGDLLFNPDWWWHRTSAYDGLSMSVPMREVFPERTVRNNPLYTLAISRFYLLKWGVQ